jgi:hypothetical protein
MKQQGAKAHFFLHHLGNIRAIQAAAKPDNTIEILALTLLPNLVTQQFKRVFTFLIGMPIGLDRGLKVIAVVTPTTLIKNDVWIGRVHNAMGANLIRSRAHALVLR